MTENNKFPNFSFLRQPVQVVGSDFYDCSPQHLIYGNALMDIRIRGYKYGVYHHNVSPNKVQFRIGSYGQFRDMLEQRPYTKFWNGETMLESPIGIKFISGTLDYVKAIDYVSATNPSYDPRDSGFWDREYRCGQPHYDIDNLD